VPLSAQTTARKISARRTASETASRRLEQDAGPGSPDPFWGKPQEKKQIAGGGARTFGRHEWLQALVRIAIMRYVLPGARAVPRIADVSEALVRLLFSDCVPRLDKALCAAPNDFRAEHCYTDQMDNLLQLNEASLRALYVGFATDPEKMDMAKGSSPRARPLILDCCGLAERPAFGSRLRQTTRA